MDFVIGNEKVEVFRVTNFTASRQRGKVSLIGKSMGRSSDHQLLPARSVVVLLSKKYDIEFFQTKNHKLVIMVNGNAVWADNASQQMRDTDGDSERGRCGTTETNST
jgi:hypothetical protein